MGAACTQKMVDRIEQLCYYKTCKGDSQPPALRCLIAEAVGSLSFFLTIPTPSRPPPHEGPGEAQGRRDTRKRVSHQPRQVEKQSNKRSTGFDKHHQTVIKNGE